MRIQVAVIAAAGVFGALVAPAMAQPYPSKPIRFIVPSSPGRTGSRRMGCFGGGDGARPPGLFYRITSVIRMIVGAAVFAVAMPVIAQPYPSKPIRFIVPSSPGGGADTVTRLVAEALPAIIGQRMIVDNRAGASGNIGTDIAAKSPPDGYTWIMINNAQAANVSLYRNLSYDLLRDFTAVTHVDSSPHVIVVHPALPVKSVSELVRLAKSKPGALEYASAGLGTVTFLAAEIFKADAGVNLLHVPYKGGGESLLSIVSGETAVYFSPLVVALPHIHQGRLRALAVTSRKRMPQVPDIPTVAESGYPNYEFNLWNGLLLPAKTPKEIVTTVHDAVLKALAAPHVHGRLVDMASTVIGDQPEQFGAFVKSEVESIAQLVKKLNLTAEALK